VVSTMRKRIAVNDEEWPVHGFLHRGAALQLPAR
jgi:hypothetical protein